MQLTKTQKRVDWINSNRNSIKAARTKMVLPPRHRGYNARGIGGMSGGGWGWWANALDIANIDCCSMDFWSGSNPTPSTAINEGIAKYITQNAPDDLI